MTTVRARRLSLMTYHGVVLLLAGYQADEEHILRQYRSIVDKLVLLPRYLRKIFLLTCLLRLEVRYPTGSLWILNRVGGVHAQSLEHAAHGLCAKIGQDPTHVIRSRWCNQGSAGRPGAWPATHVCTGRRSGKFTKSLSERCEPSQAGKLTPLSHYS